MAVDAVLVTVLLVLLVVRLVSGGGSAETRRGQ